MKGDENSLFPPQKLWATTVPITKGSFGFLWQNMNHHIHQVNIRIQKHFPQFDTNSQSIDWILYKHIDVLVIQMDVMLEMECVEYKSVTTSYETI